MDWGRRPGGELVDMYAQQGVPAAAPAAEEVQQPNYWERFLGEMNRGQGGGLINMLISSALKAGMGGGA